MSLRRMRWAMAVAIGLIALTASSVGRAQGRAAVGMPDTVTFCVGAENLPLSSEGSDPPGYEVELARVIAARAGLVPRFTWLHAGQDDVEQAVRDGRCDVAPGVLAEPGPMAERPSLDGLVLTRPYYAAEYLIVRRRDTPALRTLAEAGETRIAVEGESVVAHTLRQRGRRVHVLHEHGDLLEAVASGRARYGYVWGPIAAWTARAHEALTVEPIADGPDRWPMAFAVRRSDGVLRDRLDQAIAALHRDGAAEPICRRYGQPRCTPDGTPAH